MSVRKDIPWHGAVVLLDRPIQNIYVFQCKQIAEEKVDNKATMRRRRVGGETALVSPTSRRRLNNPDDPSRQIMQVFSASTLFDAVLSPSDSETANGDTDTEQEQEQEETPAASTQEEEEEEEEEHGEGLGLSLTDDIQHSISMVYEAMLNSVDLSSALVSPPHTPSPPPPAPPAAPPVVTYEEEKEQQLQPPVDIMINPSPRLPNLVVQLPTGGFSFAPSPLFEALQSPPARRTSPRVISQFPANGRVINNRLRRVRRELFRGNNPTDTMVRVRRHNGVPMRPSRILTRRDLPTLQLTRYLNAPDSPEPPPPAPIHKVRVTEELGVPDGVCAICLEQYKVGDQITYVACQSTDHTKDHLFHHACISQWVLTCRGKRTCPECRGEW